MDRSGQDARGGPPEPARRTQTSETEVLANLVHKIETREDFLKCMDYRESGETGQEDVFRNRVYQAYVKKKCNSDRVYSEYDMFNIYGEISEYFLPDDDVDDDMAAELACTSKLYMAVAARNALHLLDEDYNDDHESIAQSNGTMAQKYKAHLERFRLNEGFDEWNVQRVLSVRPAIYRAVKTSRQHHWQATRTASKYLPTWKRE